MRNCSPVSAVKTEAAEDRFGFAILLGYASGAAGLLEISNYESRGVPNERVQITGGNGASVMVENVTRVTYSRDAEPMAPGRGSPTSAAISNAPIAVNSTPRTGCPAPVRSAPEVSASVRPCGPYRPDWGAA